MHVVQIVSDKHLLLAGIVLRWRWGRVFAKPMDQTGSGGAPLDLGDTRTYKKQSRPKNGQTRHDPPQSFSTSLRSLRDQEWPDAIPLGTQMVRERVGCTRYASCKTINDLGADDK